MRLFYENQNFERTCLSFRCNCAIMTKSGFLFYLENLSKTLEAERAKQWVQWECQFRPTLNKQFL